jgi:hypothetical protein
LFSIVAFWPAPEQVRVDADFSATPFKAKIANAEWLTSFPPPHVVG